jgi:hypothetical protein
MDNYIISRNIDKIIYTYAVIQHRSLFEELLDKTYFIRYDLSLNHKYSRIRVDKYSDATFWYCIYRH